MTLGEKLKQAREEREITISEVAEHTRISPIYLQAIENDEFKTLPGGIFNKGFIKSFAKYVGVDENEAMQDYAAQFSTQTDGEDSDQPKTYRPEVLTDDRTSGSMVPTIIFAVIILGLMTWGILTLVDYMQNQPNQPVANTNTNTANSNAANTANANVTAPIPATDEIKVELKTKSSPISVSYQADGKNGTKLLDSTEASLNVEAKENVKFSFAKSLLSEAQLTLNGKEIKLPSEPQNQKRVSVEFEITKNNIKQILTDGEYKYSEVPAP